jgi:hypothetical protein
MRPVARRSAPPGEAVERSQLRRLCAALAVAHGLGCASPPQAARTVLAGSPARTLLILPLNVPAVMAPELEAARPVVWEELETYLRAQGKELKTVSFSSARELWLGAIRKVRAEAGARAGFDEAARAFALELARHADFEAMIVPSLFVREAPIAGRSARWDDVERPVEFEIRDPAAALASPDPPEVEGLAPAVSLHVVVLDAEGDEIQEELRGLDLLVRVRVSAPGSGPGFELAPRPVPLANRAWVREAIADALAPFLPRLSSGGDRGAP